MGASELLEVDWTSAPFDQLRSIQRLASNRSGRESTASGRHDLFVAYDKRTAARVLIKLASKPGLVYQQNLDNEIASLTTINRELPASRQFPLVIAHGKLRDGRVYLLTSLFDEFPLATTIGNEWIPGKLVSHVRTALEVAAALEELHRLQIFHVDLNPMNVLHRTEKGKPVIRIVDFESSYEVSRHSTGVFYNPPTTPGYSAPEISHQIPDARADLFSLGAVLYTLLVGYQWSWQTDVSTCIKADRQIDAELRTMLLAATNPKRDKRPASVQEFRNGLSEYLERIWPGRSGA